MSSIWSNKIENQKIKPNYLDYDIYRHQPLDKIRTMVGFRFFELINYLCVLKITFELNRRNFDDLTRRSRFEKPVPRMFVRQKRKKEFCPKCLNPVLPIISLV